MLLAFIAGMPVGAIVLGLVIAPTLERAEKRYWNGYAGAIEDARAGLIPGLVVAKKATILNIARRAS